VFPKEAPPGLSSGSSPPRRILHIKHFKSFFFVFRKRLSSINGTFSYSQANLVKDSLFVGDHVEKVASFPNEDLAKSGYEPDMKFKLKKHPSIFLATH
jgi:hypothetical protein